MYVNATYVSVPDIPPPDKFPKFGIVDVFPVFPDYPAILEEIKKEENRKKKRSSIPTTLEEREQESRVPLPGEIHLYVARELYGMRAAWY